MAYIGNKTRAEVMRLWLTLDAAPTGTPTITITRGQGTALDTPIAAVNMTQGASTLEWYYNYTTEAAAQIGQYTAKYSAVVNTVTLTAYDSYDVSVNSLDDIGDDTDTIIAGLSISAGARSIVINVKDGSANPVEGVKASVYNSANDDLPNFGNLITDTLGNTATINLDDATYTVRLWSGGIVSENETIVVAASGTKDLTVVLFTIAAPSDPDLCRLWFSPKGLDNSDQASHTIRIASTSQLTIVDGVVIENTELTFTYDSGDKVYYFDAIQGAEVHITSDRFGINHDITVPALTTQDISATGFLA